jgi:hypothetical protein
MKDGNGGAGVDVGVGDGGPVAVAVDPRSSGGPPVSVAAGVSVAVEVPGTDAVIV